MVRLLLAALALVGLSAAAGLAWLCLRPNRAEVDRALVREDWPIVADGRHNANTDLIHWRDAFWLAHAAGPYHLASPRTRIVVRRSEDARRFEEVAAFRVPGEDIRDPTFAVIGDRLFLYVMPNRERSPRPYTTLFASSADGRAWSDLAEVSPGGWLFWRPRTRDGRTWYVPAYVRGMGRVVLFRSRDGRHWDPVSTVHEGDGASETDAHFLPDGRLVATVRLEQDASLTGGDAMGTLVADAAPPYTRWRKVTSRVTRLDGPDLFVYRDRLYAVGRREGEAPGFLSRPGSVLGRKRTALFQVQPGRGLRWLSDLPSAGDTAYTGSVVRGDTLFVDYYTSDVRYDWPWLLGMFRASEIRMARVDLPALAAAAERPPSAPER